MTCVTNQGKRIRPYRSERRAEQACRTRRGIIGAARSTFLACGYLGARMQDIASAAGVSVKTVEATFGTKGQLLKAVVDVDVAGDDVPVAVLQRDAARAAEATPDPAGFLTIVGGAVAAVADRVADILLIVDQAAGWDEEIAAVAAELDRQRYKMATWIVENLGQRAPLRPELTIRRAVDTVWLLMDPVVFRRLTRDRHWDAYDFQIWFINTLRSLLLAEQAGREQPHPM